MDSITPSENRSLPFFSYLHPFNFLLISYYYSLSSSTTFNRGGDSKEPYLIPDFNRISLSLKTVFQNYKLIKALANGKGYKDLGSGG